MGIEDKFKQQFGDPDDYDEEAVENAAATAFGSNLDLPVPPGAYLVKILPDYTEDTTTKNGGKRMKLQCEIKAPKYEGRHMFFGLNYENDNEEVAERNWKRLLAIGDAIGPDALPPTADNLIGGVFIAETGLEENEYKGEIEYRPTLWGVRPQTDGPAEGPWDDDDQPDIWFDAIAHAKGGGDSDTDTDSSGGDGDGKTSTYDSDDVPF